MPSMASENRQTSQSPAPRAHLRKPTVFYAVAVTILAADQASKFFVASTFVLHEPHPVIPGIVDLTYATNTGGAFGLLPWATQILAVVAGLVAVALIVSGPRLAAAGRVIEIASALLLGGALGNLIDRVRLGYVIDFIHVHFWPVFNVADIGITVGAGLFIIAALRIPGATPKSTEVQTDALDPR